MPVTSVGSPVAGYPPVYQDPQSSQFPQFPPQQVQQPYVVAQQVPQDRHGFANLMQGVIGALLLGSGPLGLIFGGFLIIDAALDYFTGRGAWGTIARLTGIDPNSTSRSIASGIAERLSPPQPYGYNPYGYPSYGYGAGVPR